MNHAQNPTSLEYLHPARIIQRLPFAQSSNVSTHVFDLIHVDIWDPFEIPSLHS